MTVRELIERLKEYDPDYPVRILNPGDNYHLFFDDISVTFSYLEDGVYIKDPQVIIVPDAFRAECVEKESNH